MQYTGQLAMFDLRRQLMQHLQDLDLAFYDRNPVGRLVTRVTTDVDVLNDLFASGLVTILGDVLVLVFILGIMFTFSPLLTAIMLTAMPFVIVTTVIFRRSVTKSYRRIRVAIAKINSYLQEHITGIVVLQLFNRERRACREFEEVNRQHMIAFKDAITAYGWFYPVVGSLRCGAGRHLTYGGLPRGEAAVLGVVAVLLEDGCGSLPADEGTERKVQALGCDGLSGSASSKLWIPSPGCAPGIPVAAAETISDRIDDVWFLQGEWVLRDVSLPSPGETVAVGAIPERARRRSSTCSCALRRAARQAPCGRRGRASVRPAGAAAMFGVVVRDPVPVHRHAGGNLGRHGGYRRGGGGSGGRTGQPDGCHPRPAEGLRALDPRAR